MKQYDIVLIIGQRGMLDCIITGEEDEFIKGIRVGCEMNKLFFLYIAVNEYVNAGMSNANGICKIEWVYDKSGKVIGSKDYIEDNGNAKLQVLETTPLIERKISGSLL